MDLDMVTGCLCVACVGLVFIEKYLVTALFGSGFIQLHDLFVKVLASL